MQFKRNGINLFLFKIKINICIKETNVKLTRDIHLGFRMYYYGTYAFLNCVKFETRQSQQ